MSSDPSSAAPRAWLRSEQRVGGRAARPVALFGLLGTAMAVGQAWCAAMVLAGALTGRGAVNLALLGGFAVLALLRAALSVAANRLAFNAGASARRRLRTDALTRLLHAGPAQLRSQHTGELTATVVDRIEALDGLYSRWLPASMMAVAGPLIVVLSALFADPIAAVVLALCRAAGAGGDGAAGIGAAAASRHQFLALARLQARFLDRVRGIATIVLYGRAEDEARSLAAAADELRRRTMRVLRVAFLSSAALDSRRRWRCSCWRCAMAWRLLGGRMSRSRALRCSCCCWCRNSSRRCAPSAAAYQDRLHATGAAEALTGSAARRRNRSRSARSAPSRRTASPWRSRTFT